MLVIKDFFTSIWMVLEQTAVDAWWVYLLLAYCIFIGIKSSKDHVIPYIKSLIVPLLFLYLSLDSLLTSFAVTLFVALVYIIAALLGVVIGYWQVASRRVLCDRERLLIFQEGSWNTLILILVIFIAKFYFGYTSAADPQYLHNTIYEVSFLVVSGITSGMFMGRAVCYTYRLFWGPSVKLNEK